jgi:hypothetical protein
MTDQQTYAAIALSFLISFFGGRASVSSVAHSDECRPEIEAVEVAEKQISDLETALAGAEARGLKACIARERRLCKGQIEATEEAANALDCIICRKRCTDGSIP